MLKRLFDRQPQRNPRASRRRRRSNVRVEQLESRRLFAGDAFSMAAEPISPVGDVEELAAEVSTAGSEIPTERLTIAFEQVRFESQKGQEGSDLLIVNNGDGSDFSEPGEGNDLLIGGDGADVLRGGAGNDTLLGNRGNDIVLGQDGNDLLIVNNGDGSDF